MEHWVTLNSKGNSIYKFRSTERFSPEFIKELGFSENPDRIYQDYLKITSGNHNMSEDWIHPLRYQIIHF